MSDTAVVIFIKNPVKGKVKTRLAKDTDDSFALEVYKKLIQYTLKVVKESPFQPIIYFSDHVESWEEIEHDPIKVQSGNHLGERMLNAFEQELRSFSRVLLIGSDCGELKTEHLIQADRALLKNEVVIGPAKDGGYYLIGLKSVQTYLFENMPWSQDNLFDHTIQKIEEHGSSLRLLETLSDVDYLSDWKNINWR